MNDKLTIEDIDKAIKIAEAIFTIPTSKINRLNLLRQLIETMRERDRYKELWENVHIYYSKSRGEIEALSNKESDND